MLKKALMLISGNAFASAISLVRNLIIARMISPEDYGIAATFAISMSIVEMMSYLGLQQLLIVDRDGDLPDVQAAAQGFQVMRGLLSAGVMFLISGIYARFMGIGQVAWAFELLALVPLVNGLQHFDQHRLKRHMNFQPSVLVTSVPPLIALLAVWPAWLIWQDYRIMLATMFVQAVAMVAMSHLVAQRRYRIAYDPTLIRRAMIFGWPLLIDGILLFLIFNGEKMIVGRELGMTMLAVFSMGFTLTLTPVLVVVISIQTFFVPQLSRVRDDPPALQMLGEVAIEAGFVFGILLIVGTSLLGGPIVHLLLGAKYEGMLLFLVQLAILQALRAAKSGSTIVAPGKEQTGNSMATNLPRVLAMPIAWLIVLRTGDIQSVILVGILAELAGMLAGLWLVRSRSGLHTRHLLLPGALFLICAVVAYVDATLHPPKPLLGTHFHSGHILVVLSGVIALASLGSLRKVVWARLKGRG